jgi:hypothetical protein
VEPFLSPQRRIGNDLLVISDTSIAIDSGSCIS